MLGPARRRLQRRIEGLPPVAGCGAEVDRLGGGRGALSSLRGDDGGIAVVIKGDAGCRERAGEGEQREHRHNGVRQAVVDFRVGASHPSQHVISPSGISRID